MFRIEHHLCGGGKRVNTRPYLGQESKEGAKKARARVQKGGQKCQKSYTTKKAGKKDTVYELHDTRFGGSGKILKNSVNIL